MKLLSELLLSYGPHVVKWKRRGIMFVDGIAFARQAGDEDVVDAKLADRLMRMRQVVVVGPVKYVMNKRTISGNGEIEDVADNAG